MDDDDRRRMWRSRREFFPRPPGQPPMPGEAEADALRAAEPAWLAALAALTGVPREDLDRCWADPMPFAHDMEACPACLALTSSAAEALRRRIAAPWMPRP
jgi:hypothetical protein